MSVWFQFLLQETLLPWFHYFLVIVVVILYSVAVCLVSWVLSKCIIWWMKHKYTLFMILRNYLPVIVLSILCFPFLFLFVFMGDGDSFYMVGVLGDQWFLEGELRSISDFYKVQSPDLKSSHSCGMGSQVVLSFHDNMVSCITTVQMDGHVNSNFDCYNSRRVNLLRKRWAEPFVNIIPLALFFVFFAIC